MDGWTGADAKLKERKGDSFPLADDLLSFLWGLQEVQAFCFINTQTRARKSPLTLACLGKIVGADLRAAT